MPAWAGDDFDSLYVLRIARDRGKVSVTFSRDAQRLDGQAASCP